MTDEAAQQLGRRPETLVRWLERGIAGGDRDVTFLDGRGAERVPWRQIHAQARQIADRLTVRGAGPGTRVAIQGRTSRLLVTTLQAIWLTGATPCVLPARTRLSSADEFIASTVSRIESADFAAAVVDDSIAPALAEPLTTAATIVGMAELAAEAASVPADRFQVASVGPDDIALLQFTSGSTSQPRGVLLTHAAMCANLRAIIASTGGIMDADVLRMLSWLPLYHDMGLIGFCLLPMLNASTTYLADPHDFIASPRRWLGWITALRPTVIGAPNFAYMLAAKALERDATDYDLSSVRIAFNGAEPVDPGVVESFCTTGEAAGFDRTAMFPVYGMAEATLAVTFPEIGTGMAVDAVDGGRLESVHRAEPAKGPGSRRMVRLGKPLPGIEITIVGPDTGTPLPERCVGEIRLRGDSLLTEYLGQPRETAAAFDTEGRLRTGDLGYLVDGELVICGRLKDVIIIGGRNHYPQDLERAVQTVPGVRPGNVAAVAVTGKGNESFVIVAEFVGERTDATYDEILVAVRKSAGIRPSDVVLLAPGRLPKTSSGKIKRSACRKLYESGALRQEAEEGKKCISSVTAI